MRRSWYDAATHAIGKALAALQAATPQPTEVEIIAAIDAAYPFGQRAYWPYKAWLKARRDALAVRGIITRSERNRRAKVLQRLREGLSQLTVPAPPTPDPNQQTIEGLS